MADKDICPPDSPNEEYAAPASRNAVGIKPSAGSICKDDLVFKELHPPIAKGRRRWE